MGWLMGRDFCVILKNLAGQVELLDDLAQKFRLSGFGFE